MYYIFIRQPGRVPELVATADSDTDMWYLVSKYMEEYGRETAVYAERLEEI